MPIECSVHEHKKSLVRGPCSEVYEELGEARRRDLRMKANRIGSVEEAG
jgi:hypothetical protein